MQFSIVVCASYGVQDYPVSGKSILSLWQQHKFTHEVTVKELLRTRSRGVDHWIGLVRYVKQQEDERLIDLQMESVKRMLGENMCAFISHPVVNEWKRQYSEENFGKLHRFKMLLLRGRSQTGKSMFAKSLFGPEHTLLLNCQRNTTSLPSLRPFTRTRHKAILLDEVTVPQVLEFKALLQSTVEKIAMAQSQCGQHQYTVWMYGIAWILASNDFSLDEVPDQVSAEDSEWHNKNIVSVELPGDMTWYVKQ